MAEEEIVKKKLAGLHQLSDVLKGVRLLVENDPLGDDPEDMWAYLADVAKAPVPLRIYETGEAPDPPADGDVVVYARTDRKLYSMDHLGVETLMSGGLGAATNRLFEGRITPTQGVPVENAAKSAITSLWIEPYRGNQVKLFNGVGWDPYTVLSREVKLTDVQTGNTTNGSTTIGGLSDTSHFVVGTLVSGIGIPAGASVATIVSGSSVTISAAATADGTGVNLTFKDPKDSTIDLYLVADGGAAAVRKVKWTDATTRSVAIAYQDGVKVKDGDATWLYIGFYRTFTTDGQTEWGQRHRLIKNEYNRERFSFMTFQNVGYTLSSATFILENSSNNAIIYGLFDGNELCHFQTDGAAVYSTGAPNLHYYEQGIGIDSGTVGSAAFAILGTHGYVTISGTSYGAFGIRSHSMSVYQGKLTEGYHYIAGLAKRITGNIVVQAPMLRAMGGFLG
jgi:hypothetical protein